MKTKKAFKISFRGQLVCSLGLCCLSSAVYAINSEFAGSFHNCALKNDGSIACWGTNYDGRSTPPTGNDFIQVSAGGYHTCALKSDGSIVCWEDNFWDQSTPPTGNDFTQVSAGLVNICALKSDGSIVCWGDDEDGQSTPPAGNDFTQVSAGYYHGCALKSDGSIVCWGDDEDGQSTPPAGNDFTQVSANGHTCALKTDGSIACWGGNFYGQSTPPAGNNFTQVTAGFIHTCALKSDGSIACWGGSLLGQLTPPTGNDFTQVTAGDVAIYWHTCALKSDGSIACWGADNFGQSTPPASNDFVGGQLPGGGTQPAELPALPATTLSGATSQSQFAGGTTNDNRASFKNNFTATDAIDVIGTITVAPNDVGKEGSIFIVVVLTNSEVDGVYMKDGEQWKLWDGEPANLTVVEGPRTLNATEEVVIVTSLTGLPGSLTAFFGYKANNEIHYNAESIQFSVSP